MSRIERIRHLYQTTQTPLEALWKWAVGAGSRGERYQRFRALQVWAAERGQAEPDDAKAWEHRRIAYRKRKRAIYKRLHPPGRRRAPSVGGWHPNAQHVPYSGSGGFTGGGKKIVWHTTEYPDLPHYSGSAPHFTLHPQTGRLYQHVPITQASSSLINAAGGVETNHAGAIQVELIGYASKTQDWSDADYAHIATLARWIEKWANVPRRCTVTFVGGGHTNHLSAPAWVSYAGHLGHQHVPENSHWDPGLLRIDKVL